MAAKGSAAVNETGDFEDDFDFGEDAEIIAPKVDLRRKAKERRSKPGDPDPIALAEAAMRDMSDKFSGWMQTEANALVDAWQAADEADLTDTSRADLFARSHDIKGQAMTLGFPAAGRVAASLCRLLDTITEPARLPRELIRQHVLAIKAIARESQQDQANPVADKLAGRLTEVTDDFLASIPA
jgi:hypothetical protein